MAFLQRRPQRDPKLEETRAAILNEHAPPNTKPLAQDLENLTRRIHAGFLFEGKDGDCEAWRILMEYFSSTSPHNIRCDWKAFACELGFSRKLIQSIENVRPENEDNVTNILRAFAQYEDSTLSKIVHALDQIDRPDIILNINKPLTDLVESILRDFDDSNLSDSGYMSRNSTEELQEKIIIPKWIPVVPCLLKDQKHMANALQKIESCSIFGTNESCVPVSNTSTTQITASEYVPNIPPVIHETNVQLSNDKQPLPPVKTSISASVDLPKPCRTVMLTFSADGRAAANELANALRTPRMGNKRVGVLILQEQLSFLNRDAVAFITGCFKQVDFIVPVVTPEYLRSVQANARPQEPSHNSDCVDANWTRYIYRLSVDEFKKENCLNKRVRSIIPDDILKPMYKTISNMHMPVLSAFHKLSDTEKFANKIISLNI